MKSREHILLSTVVADAWRKGEALDLAALIARVQSPPVQKIGVLDLEAFYPAGDRFQLAMALNGLLASPSFQAWLQGDPLDVGQLLYTPQGKPRLSVVSIAHLNDAERMFFVSMLFGADAVVDAPAARDHEPARHPVHGRGRGLPASGGDTPVEAAAA